MLACNCKRIVRKYNKFTAACKHNYPILSYTFVFASDACGCFLLSQILLNISMMIDSIWSIFLLRSCKTCLFVTSKPPISRASPLVVYISHLLVNVYILFRLFCNLLFVYFFTLVSRPLTGRVL
jgi:hypothetical protein